MPLQALVVDQDLGNDKDVECDEQDEWTLTCYDWRDPTGWEFFK